MTMAGRPKKVNPNGETKAVTVIVAKETYDIIKLSATNRGITVGDVIRETLDAGLKVAG